MSRCGTEIPPALVETFKEATSIARSLFDTFGEYGIPVEEDWVDHNVNLVLAQAVHDWAIGLPFKFIMEITDIPEGNVVRIINMVNEALSDLAKAAKIMGCLAVSEKFEQAMELIKRDIIFASSLYFD